MQRAALLTNGKLAVRGFGWSWQKVGILWVAAGTPHPALHWCHTRQRGVICFRRHRGWGKVGRYAFPPDDKLLLQAWIVKVVLVRAEETYIYIIAFIWLLYWHTCIRIVILDQTLQIGWDFSCNQRPLKYKNSNRFMVLLKWHKPLGVDMIWQVVLSCLSCVELRELLLVAVIP